MQIVAIADRILLYNNAKIGSLSPIGYRRGKGVCVIASAFPVFLIIDLLPILDNCRYSSEGLDLCVSDAVANHAAFNFSTRKQHIAKARTIHLVSKGFDKLR